MDGAWKQIAATGTDKQVQAIPQQEGQLEVMRERLAGNENASRLLAGVGLEVLRQQAGYIAAITEEELLRADKALEKTRYHETVLQHLSLIAYGRFPDVYSEWLHWAAMSQSKLPAEAIPLLLNLATENYLTRSLTKRMIGGRGRWLVRNASGAWRWIHEVETGKSPRTGKHKKQEERIIVMLKRGIFYNLGTTVRFEMRQLEQPWSQRFSAAILETLQGVMGRNAHLSSHDQLELIGLFQLGLHPHLRDEFEAIFANYTKDLEVQKVLQEAIRVLAFRLAIRESFGIHE